MEYLCIYIYIDIFTPETYPMSLEQYNQTIISGTDSNDQVLPLTAINDHIFLGQGRTTAYATILTSLGITHVISVGRSPHLSVKNGPFTKLELQNVADQDSTQLSIHFPTLFAFMRQAITDKGRIYVHCEAGCSRSPTVVIAFLRANGYYVSLQEAYDQVKKLRPCINPNQGFKRQLREFFCESLR